jgi:hypothetical protein
MTDGPWEQELIPDESNVLRQVHFSHLTSSTKKKRFPNETHFTPGGDGLSVNWDRYCDTLLAYIIIGLTHKSNRQYKNPVDFKVFKMHVQILRKIDGIEDVIHDPKFYGNPSVIGNPNNRSHSLIKYPNDEELRLKLSDLIRDNYDESICKCDASLIEKEVGELRERISKDLTSKKE